MIVWNTKIKKANNILKAVIDTLNKQDVIIDGVVEVFNDGIDQGMILKIYDKYDENLDICVWVYQPTDRTINNEMRIMFGHHSDCLENNMWIEFLSFDTVKRDNAREMHQLSRDLIVEKINQYIEKEIVMKI